MPRMNRNGSPTVISRTDTTGYASRDRLLESLVCAIAKQQAETVIQTISDYDLPEKTMHSPAQIRCAAVTAGTVIFIRLGVC